MTSLQLTESLRSEAARLGFELSGVSPAVEPVGFRALERWLDQGFHGEMHYLSERRKAYQSPQHVFDGCVSLLLLGMRYAGLRARNQRPGLGQVASYAAGAVDYHEVIWDRLNDLVTFYQNLTGGKARGVVDTAPLLEREFAQLAGLGWQGKNTLLISPSEGSYFFLAALLVDQALEPTAPFQVDHCGTCRRCLEACPTGAFVEPRVLDARRCISYLTIELRSPIPVEFREALGDWVFGCDVCQDVCPWNRFSKQPEEARFRDPRPHVELDLSELLSLDDAGFRERFRHTPLWRAKRRGILRNACLVLGNQRHPDSIPALTRALSDSEPLVRGAAAWALGRLGRAESVEDLMSRQLLETEELVQEEIRHALHELHRPSTHH